MILHSQKPRNNAKLFISRKLRKIFIPTQINSARRPVPALIRVVAPGFLARNGQMYENHVTVLKTPVAVRIASASVNSRWVYHCYNFQQLSLDILKQISFRIFQNLLQYIICAMIG